MKDISIRFVYEYLYRSFLRQNENKRLHLFREKSNILFSQFSSVLTSPTVPLLQQKAIDMQKSNQTFGL